MENDDVLSFIAVNYKIVVFAQSAAGSWNAKLLKILKDVSTTADLV
jgi:hypothetical protein